MIRRHEISLRFALMALDSVLALAVLMTVFAVRFGADWVEVVNKALPAPGLFIAEYVLTWVLLLAANGLYRARARWSIWSEARGVVQATVEPAFITLAALFFVRLPDVSPVSRVEDLEGTPVLSAVSGPDQVLPLAAKRLFDIVGAAVGLVLLSPLFAVAALGIFMTDGRPVIFRQPRAGMNGRRFRVVKFRT